MTDEAPHDLDHSRPLDVHRWSDHPVVGDWVYRFWDEHLAARFPKQTRGRPQATEDKYQFKVLLLDLYVAWREDPTLLIGVGKTNSAYSAGSRYNALHISARMIQLVNAMVDLGFLHESLGSEVTGRTTRIWPTARLIAEFERLEFGDLDIGHYEGRECIVLNDKRSEDDENAKPVPYEDTDHPSIVPNREALTEYNRFLSTLFIDVATLEEPKLITTKRTDGGKEEKQLVRTTQDNKFVRRIFYRGSWELGGRFHGGFWQQVPSNYRQQIRINDQPTVEVDYSGLHVALAYALQGAAPPTDPYAIPLPETGIAKELQRKVVKTLVLSAINAKERTKAFQAFRNEANKSGLSKEVPPLTDALLDDILFAFEEANPAIQGYIGSDSGVRLMAIDGRITDRLIQTFTERAKPLLTVHDSYIVLYEDERLLNEEMIKAAEAETGSSSFRMTVESLSPQQVEALRDPLDPKRLYDGYTALANKTTPADGYLKRWDRYKRWSSSR